MKKINGSIRFILLFSLVQAFTLRPDLPAQERMTVNYATKMRSEQEVLTLCDQYVEQDKIPAAIEFLESEKENFPYSIRLRKRLADYYQQSEQLSASIATYKEIIKIDRKNPAYWRELAKLYTWNDKQPEAILAYREALVLQPNDVQTMKQLSRLYIWNDRQEDAYALQKEILRLEPDNIALWREHGIQARWLKKNEEAIDSFKNIIRRDHENVEAYYLLGETYLWMDKTDEAKICFDQVLKMQPNHIQATFYSAQLQQWQPSGWWEARKKYRRILQQQPDHEGSKKYYGIIRKEYGPFWQNEGQYIHDSNNLKKREVTSSYEQYLSPRWKISGAVLYRNLEEQKPAGHFLAYGQGGNLGSTWYLSAKTRVVASAGYINFNERENFFLSKLQWQQTLSSGENWPGQLFSTLSFKYDQVLDGVLAIKNRYTAGILQHQFYWKPVTKAKFGSDFQYGWYSDQNRKTQLYVTGEYQFYAGKPVLFFESVYSYQDMKIMYPDAVPYWTPNNFWTISTGLDAVFPVRYNLLFRVGYALTQQTGNELANNYKAEFNWHPNDYSYLFVHYYDFGSQYYAFKSFMAGFLYRW
ncbi:MAG TPA: tetratricopeptide repeat protein [Bacteroidetes bacterium]|nr:tetratricopeptide repeat protein [Bacteroidota bacterium]